MVSIKRSWRCKSSPRLQVKNKCKCGFYKDEHTEMDTTEDNKGGKASICLSVLKHFNHLHRLIKFTRSDDDKLKKQAEKEGWPFSYKDLTGLERAAALEVIAEEEKVTPEELKSPRTKTVKPRGKTPRLRPRSTKKDVEVPAPTPTQEKKKRKKKRADWSRRPKKQVKKD